MYDIPSIAFIATIAAFWGQIRGIIDRIKSIFIIRFTLHGEVAESVANYIWRNGKVLQWGDRYIRSASAWVRPLERMAEVAFEHAPIQPLLAWVDGRPVSFVCPRENGFGGKEQAIPQNFNVLTISSLRWCLDIKKLTKSAIDATLARQTTGGNRYRVRRVSGRRNSGYAEKSIDQGATAPAPISSNQITPDMRLLHWFEQDIGSPQPDQPFAAVALCHQQTLCVSDFRRWLSLKKWYSQRGIPWRRGHLYYGPPGTGKTTIARALAQESDMPVFAYDLSTLDNEQFCEAWQEMQHHTPCMALIEDIDGCFHGRKNILANDKRDTLTFDCLLNALGGIQTCDGVFIVITTNKPELLDDALGKPSGQGSGTTRPGRIDAGFCFQAPAIEQRAHILQRIMGSSDEIHIAASEGMTAAQVTEYAIEKALQETWKAS